MDIVGNVISKKDFNDFVKSNKLEVFTDVEVTSMLIVQTASIKKSTDAKVLEEDLEHVINSLKKVEVMGDNFKKSIYYVREQQIGWFEKGFGFYLDTDLNRKLECVGQEFMSSNYLEKGKRATLGEVRVWGNGKKYKKTNDGWSLVEEGGKTTKEEQAKEDKPEAPSKDKNDVKIGEPFNPEDYDKHIKKISSEIADFATKNNMKQSVGGGTTYYKNNPTGNESVTNSIYLDVSFDRVGDKMKLGYRPSFGGGTTFSSMDLNKIMEKKEFKSPEEAFQFAETLAKKWESVLKEMGLVW